MDERNSDADVRKPVLEPRTWLAAGVGLAILLLVLRTLAGEQREDSAPPAEPSDARASVAEAASSIDSGAPDGFERIEFDEADLDAILDRAFRGEPEEEPPPGRVRVRVTDGRGAGLDLVPVWLMTPEQLERWRKNDLAVPQHRAATDPLGMCEFTGVALGVYGVSSDPLMDPDRALVHVQVGAEPQWVGVTLELDADRFVAGRVVFVDRRPAGTVDVRGTFRHRVEGTTRFVERSVEVVTDSRGAFRIGGLARGAEGGLRAYPRDARPFAAGRFRSQRHPARSGQANVLIRLPRTGRLRVRCVDPQTKEVLQLVGLQIESPYIESSHWGKVFQYKGYHPYDDLAWPEGELKIWAQTEDGRVGRARIEFVPEFESTPVNLEAVATESVRFSKFMGESYRVEDSMSVGRRVLLYGDDAELRLPSGNYSLFLNEERVTRFEVLLGQPLRVEVP